MTNQRIAHGGMCEQHEAFAQAHGRHVVAQKPHLQERRVSSSSEGLRRQHGRLFETQDSRVRNFQELCRGIFNGALAVGFLVSCPQSGDVQSQSIS